MAARRAPLVLLVALLVALGAPMVGPGVALADKDPVAERTAITYRLDRQRGRVAARASVRFTNRIPTQRVGNRLRRYYLEQWGPIAISADATGVKVKPRSVKYQRVPSGGAYDNLVFTFPRIYEGQSVSFTVTWSVPGQGAGSGVSGTVVGPAYSHFCWSGQPVDTGPIQLVLPRSLEAVTQGSPVRTTVSGRERRITARARDLATFYACTDVYDPTLLVRRDLTSPGGHPVSVESLPGHEAWLDGTSASVAEALAAVEGLVGAPIPGEDPIRVREVPSTALQGYAGEFDPKSGVIRLGADGASVALLAHELSHAWFNADTLSTNWLWEGLAEWASRTSVGVPCDHPVEQPFGGKPHLADWQVLQSGVSSFEDQQVVQWQYEAACAIQGQVSAAIGEDRMREVLALLRSGDSPYDLLPATEPVAVPQPSAPTSTSSPGDGPTEPPRLPPGGALPSPQATTAAAPSAAPTITPLAANVSPTRSSKRRTRPVDWRQWLDVVDEAGLEPAGVTDRTFGEDLLVATGVIKRSAVKGRAETRAAFHELRALSPDGRTPVVVRRSLDDWDFDVAARDMRLARKVADAIDALPADAPGVADLWAAYERAASRQALQRLRDRLS